MNKKEWSWMDNRLICEFCDKAMTEEDHAFCDICPECMEKYFKE